MKIIAVLILATASAVICLSEGEENNGERELESNPVPESESIDEYEIIERAIQTIEETAGAVSKVDEGQMPWEETELLHNEISDTLEDLAEVLKEPAYSHTFLKAKGIDRVIMPFMDVDNGKLKGLVLTILKSLFYEIPETLEAVPITALDKILDTFENDDNLANKAHALDILFKWLPENPKAQVRVMKLKGLEPFYNQVSKLDTSVISTLLDLFNTILDEHIKVRDRKNSIKIDADKLMLYKRIGLVERMSTPTVCNGLLNIFKATWSYSNDNNDIIAPVFELIKNMKPYCVNVLRGKNKAITLFEAFLKYVDDDNKKEYFDALDVNVTDTKLVLQDFVEELKKPPMKDEL